MDVVCEALTIHFRQFEKQQTIQVEQHFQGQTLQYSDGGGFSSHRCVKATLLHWLQVYEEPTVLLAKRVTGEEEVPEGCVAVVTPDAPDVLSHVSVRARNMRVLFAICHEAQPLAEIEKLAGKVRSQGI